MKKRDNQLHIGIFGKRNVGKSSLINRLTKQEIAIVSDIAGTTTDPVKKSIEIFGIGPVVLIDTAGIDDVGEIGKKRIEKTKNVLQQIDLAIIVIAKNHFDVEEEKIIEQLKSLETPFLIVNNKFDIAINDKRLAINEPPCTLHPAPAPLQISALTGYGMEELIEAMKSKIPETIHKTHSLLEGLVKENDTVLLITPIDSEAPEGRLILPQVQTIRAILDLDAIAVTLKENKIENYLNNNPKPNLVITDSQVFRTVAPLIPTEIPFTSFSILFARFKGDFESFVQGTKKIAELKENDKILMLESCTHASSCEDIGRVKIPHWLSEFTGKKLQFDFISGLSPIANVEKYAIVVQCGGCMFTQKQLQNRIKQVTNKGVSITNYGMLIAYITGIFERAVKPLL